MATKAESMHAVLQRLDYFRQSLAQIDSLLPPPPPPAAAATTAGAAGRSTSTAGRSGAGAGFGGVDPAALRAANERATAATARAEAAESGLRVATAKLDAASKEAQSKSAALTKLAEAHMKVQKEAQGLKERVAKLQEAVAERDESVKLIGDRFVSVQTENATMSVSLLPVEVVPHSSQHPLNTRTHPHTGATRRDGTQAACGRGAAGKGKEGSIECQHSCCGTDGRAAQCQARHQHAAHVSRGGAEGTR